VREVESLQGAGSQCCNAFPSLLITNVHLLVACYCYTLQNTVSTWIQGTRFLKANPQVRNPSLGSLSKSGPPSPPPKPSHLTGINRKVGINSFPFFFSQVGSAVANQDRQHSRRGICTAGSCTAVARVSILLACLSLSLITLCGSPRIRRVRLALAHWISVVFFVPFPFFVGSNRSRSLDS
jgi:hypothetical protein